jgi:hypothetical protein
VSGSQSRLPRASINTASAAHQGATLDFDDLQSTKNFGAMKAYRRSKLYNITTYALTAAVVNAAGKNKE